MIAALVGLTILWLLESRENWQLRGEIDALTEANAELQSDVDVLTPLAKAGVTYNILLQQDAAEDGYELTHAGYKALARDVMQDAA
jgi:hypothetical protein